MRPRCSRRRPPRTRSSKPPRPCWQLVKRRERRLACPAPVLFRPSVCLKVPSQKSLLPKRLGLGSQGCPACLEVPQLPAKRSKRLLLPALPMREAQTRFSLPSSLVLCFRSEVRSLIILSPHEIHAMLSSGALCPPCACPHVHSGEPNSARPILKEISHASSFFAPCPGGYPLPSQ
jgi:hypothetical protein